MASMGSMGPADAEWAYFGRRATREFQKQVSHRTASNKAAAKAAPPGPVHATCDGSRVIKKEILVSGVWLSSVSLGFYGVPQANPACSGAFVCTRRPAPNAAKRRRRKRRRQTRSNSAPVVRSRCDQDSMVIRARGCRFGQIRPDLVKVGQIRQRAGSAQRTGPKAARSNSAAGGSRATGQVLPDRHPEAC